MVYGSASAGNILTGETYDPKDFEVSYALTFEVSYALTFCPFCGQRLQEDADAREAL